MIGNMRASAAVLCFTALVACGGGGDGVSGGLGSGGGSAADTRASPFPPARPALDPTSSVAEVESRTRSVLVAYDDLMVEVFRQINEIYQTIESGLDSSDDPETLQRDARLYDRIASGFCATTRDAQGDIVSLSGCSANPLALRHPIYDVLVYIDRYDLMMGHAGFSDIQISSDVAGESRLPRTLTVCTDDGFCSGTSPASEVEATHLDAGIDVPDGFIGEEDECLLQFEPFVFGEGPGSTNVNECAALLQDAATVLQRLGSR